MRNPSFDREKEMQLLQQAPHYSVRELAIQFGLKEQVVRNICSRNKTDFKGKRNYTLNKPKVEVVKRDYQRGPTEVKIPFERPKAVYNQIPSPYGIGSELLFSK